MATDSGARRLPTRTGTMEIAIPKLRERSNFPHWLRERRKRAEWALATVSAQRGPPAEGQEQIRQTPQPARAREHPFLPAPMARSGA